MSETTDKKTYAQRRREARKGELRELLKGHEYLRQLHALIAEDIPAERVQAARLKADVVLRLLSKCLPDLRAVEHTGEITHNYVAEVPAVAQNSEDWAQQHTPPRLNS